MDNYLDLMMQSRLFKGFSKYDCKCIYSLMQPRCMNYIKNEVIIHEGNKVDCIGIIVRGRISCAKYDCEGKVNLMEIMECPMLLCTEIVLTSSRISPLTIISAEDSSVLFFPYNRFMENDSISDKYKIKMMNNIIHLLANDNIKKMYKIIVLSKKSLRERILMYLHLMETKRGESTFSIGMNREQFAQYLCVNRSALSNELSIMKKEGLISFDKNIFTVHNNLNIVQKYNIEVCE